MAAYLVPSSWQPSSEMPILLSTFPLPPSPPFPPFPLSPVLELWTSHPLHTRSLIGLSYCPVAGMLGSAWTVILKVTAALDALAEHLGHWEDLPAAAAAASGGGSVNQGMNLNRSKKYEQRLSVWCSTVIGLEETFACFLGKAMTTTTMTHLTILSRNCFWRHQSFQHSFSGSPNIIKMSVMILSCSNVMTSSSSLSSFRQLKAIIITSSKSL